MAIIYPFRLPMRGAPLAAEVQADLDAISQYIDTLTVTGDITITGPGNGIIVTTPDGLHTWRIAVDNAGNLTTTLVT